MLIDFDLMYLIDEKLFNTKSSSNTKKTSQWVSFLNLVIYNRE